MRLCQSRLWNILVYFSLKYIGKFEIQTSLEMEAFEMMTLVMMRFGIYCQVGSYSYAELALLS